MTNEEIQETFRYHPASKARQRKHEDFREAMRSVTTDIAADLPPCRERSLFITKMQEALMMANAALAIHGARTGKL